MNKEERAILDTPYSRETITTSMLTRIYGLSIVQQGGIRGEDEQARWVTQSLAVKVPGQRGYRQQ